MVDFDVNVRLTSQDAAMAIANIQGGLQGVEREAEDASKALAQMDGAAAKLGKGFIDFEDIAKGALMRVGELGVEALQNMGRAAVGFVTDSVRVFAEFEASMKNVQALSGATGAEFDSLEEKARELGATTRYSASEAADAMGFLAMAGFEVNEILSATPAMLDLATAGSLDLAAAADIASNVMGQFGIEAENTTLVTNVLAATAASANTDVTQMADALNYLGANANSLDMSLEETAAIIGVLGDSGIQASAAGRALGTALVKLADPTDKMVGAMEDLNVAAFDAQGEFVGMEDLLRQIEEGMVGMTKEQEAAAAMALVGSDAYGELNILLERGSEAFAQYTEDITDTEKAMEIAGIKGEGTAGSFKILQSAVQEAQISIGEGLNPAVTAGTEFLTEFITKLFAGDDATQGMASAAELLAEKIRSVNVGKLVSDIKQIIGVAQDAAAAIAKLVSAAQTLANNSGIGAINRFNTSVVRGIGGIAGRISGSFSTGGLVGGNGSGTADDKIIAVSSGEYVIRADVVEALGKKYFDTINSGRVELGELMPSQASLTPQTTTQTVTTNTGSSQGVYWEGNIGPTSTGAHFDIKRSDRGYFDRAFLDQYTNINGGRELSGGLTVHGGRFGASRSYGEHRGWDFSFGGKTGLTLENGAQWLDSKPTAHGDKARFQIPSGEIFEILHGKFDGQGGGMGTSTSTQEIVTDAEKARVKAQEELARAVESATDQISRQTERMAENVAESELSNEVLNLELDLLRATNGETGDAIKLLEMQVEQSAELAKFTDELNQKVEQKLITEEEQNMTLEKFEELQGKKLDALKEELSLLDNIESLERFNDQMERYNESGQSSIDTIGDRIAMLEQETALVQAGVEDYDDTLQLLQAEMEIKQELTDVQAALNEQLERGNISEEKYSETLENAQGLAQEKLDAINAEIEATQQLQAAQQVQAEERERQAAIEQQYQQIIDNATGAFANFAGEVISGSQSAGEAVKDLASTILSNLANQAFNSLFGGLFGGIFGGGGGGGLSFFADGGVVDRPTNAIIGEAGAEAVIPLKGGKVPVEMNGKDSGGGTTNITVNVTTQGGNEDGRALGRQISEAIKAEIANQKRSGGLLR